MHRKILACTVSAAALSFSVASAMAQTTTLNGGGSTLAEPTYISEFETYSNANPSIAFSYEGVGSGTGQKAFFNDDITQFENLPATDLVYGTIVGTSVTFGASDAALSLGGTYDITATGGYTGSNGFAGSTVDGPVIQIPTFGTPITFPYVNAGATTTVKLTDDLICGILSGQLTNWNQITKKATAGTIQVIYRSDSSGTTFLLTNHLAQVCTSSNSIFPVLPVPVTKTFASLFTNGTPPSNFTGESGSQAVAQQLENTPLSFGYLSPDYTTIAPNSANNLYSLKVASVLGANGTYYVPNVAATKIGLDNPNTSVSTDPTPPSSLSAAQNPINWVPLVPLTTEGYPVVGYTTLDLSTCYADHTVSTTMIAFLKDNYNNKSYATLINNNGFTTIANSGATNFAPAITNTFLSNKSGYNLNIGNTTTCKGLTGR